MVVFEWEATELSFSYLQWDECRDLGKIKKKGANTIFNKNEFGHKIYHVYTLKVSIYILFYGENIKLAKLFCDSGNIGTSREVIDDVCPKRKKCLSQTKSP